MPPRFVTHHGDETALGSLRVTLAFPTSDFAGSTEVEVLPPPSVVALQGTPGEAFPRTWLPAVSLTWAHTKGGRPEALFLSIIFGPSSHAQP